MTLFLVLEELERRRGWIDGPKKVSTEATMYF